MDMLGMLGQSRIYGDADTLLTPRSSFIYAITLGHSSYFIYVNKRR